MIVLFCIHIVSIKRADFFKKKFIFFFVGLIRFHIDYSLNFKDNDRFSDNLLFTAFAYIANFLLDGLFPVLDIVLNIFIMYYMKKFYYDRIRITGRPDDALSKVEKTNMTTTLIISFLSIIMHISSFLVKFYLFYLKLTIFCRNNSFDKLRFL